MYELCPSKDENQQCLIVHAHIFLIINAVESTLLGDASPPKLHFELERAPKIWERALGLLGIVGSMVLPGMLSK